MDYKFNPYESAMRYQVVVIDYVFCIQCHSHDRNTLQDKVCFFRFPLYCVGFSFFCSGLFSLKRGYLFLFCRFCSMPYIYHVNDRYNSSPRVGSVDVAPPSFILELEF